MMEKTSGIVDLMKFSVSNKDITTYTSFKEGLKEAQSKSGRCTGGI